MRVYITQPVAVSAIERLRTIADVAFNPDTSRILAKDALLAAADHYLRLEGFDLGRVLERRLQQPDDPKDPASR